MKNKELKLAFRDTLPVLTGYIVLGIGFGIVMYANGYGILWSVAMSLFIYAGSMQFAAIGLLSGGASLLTVALTTIAVNSRHLFYGLSMIDRYKNVGRCKPYLIFSLTDETYSLVCGDKKSTDYYLFVSVLNHIYWILGTALGALFGTAIRFNTTGIDFALTALFVTVFVEQWLQSEHHFPAISGVVITAVCVLIFGNGNFLIPSMIGIFVVLLIKMRKENGTDEK